MKKTILTLVAVLSFVFAYGQSGFNYKILLSQGTNIMANQNVTVRLTLKDGGASVYQETHAVTTDANGIASMVIGTGTVVSGSFSGIDWTHAISLQTEVSTDGGSTWSDMGTTAFEYVPYANMSESAKKLEPTTSDVITINRNIWAKNNGSGSILQGFRLSHDTDDWYIYMKSDNGFTIRNDQYDVFGIDDSNHKVWLRGKIDLPADGILIRNTSGGYANAFYLTNLSDGLTFKYNGAEIMKMHGAASVEVMGKLRAPESGDADMKAFAYGEWFGTSSRHTSDNVTITHSSTGTYSIDFSNAPGSSTDDYIVIGDIYNSTGFIEFSKGLDHITVHTYNTSGTLTNKSFTFVVYRK